METVDDWITEFFIRKGRLFGEVLEADRGRGVEEARQIAALLEKHGVPRGSRIIELGCGSGRISVPLAREGYRVACLDISPEYVEEALEYARSMGVEERVEGIVGDAWRVDELVEEGYNAALIVWTTLIGYRGSPEADVELLSRIRRVTAPNGKLFILKQTDRDLVVTRNAQCRMEAVTSDLGSLLVIERPRFDPVTSMLENTWTYYRKTGDELKLLGKAGFRMRIYTVTELVEIASKAGWRLEALYGDLTQGPYIPGKTSINMVLKAF